MPDQANPISEVLVVYKTDGFRRRHEFLRKSGWKLVWLQVTDVRDNGRAKERIDRFYGKAAYAKLDLFSPIISKVFRSLSRLLSRLRGKRPPAKLGDRGRIVVFQRQALPNDDPSPFALFKEIRDSLGNDYYILIVLETVLISEDWRESHLAGADVVIEPNFTAEELSERVLAVRAVEARALEEKEAGLWATWIGASLGVLCAVVIACVTAVATDLTRAFMRPSAKCVDSSWYARSFPGKPESTPADPAAPCQWVKCCLQISNVAGGPKWGFSIENRLTPPLVVRDLPEYVPGRLQETGESLEIPFSVGIPRDLPSNWSVPEIALAVSDRFGHWTAVRLPQAVRDRVEKRKHEATQPPKSSASALSKGSQIRPLRP
jgi:hypothetical protein